MALRVWRLKGEGWFGGAYTSRVDDDDDMLAIPLGRQRLRARVLGRPLSFVGPRGDVAEIGG